MKSTSAAGLAALLGAVLAVPCVAALAAEENDWTVTKEQQVNSMHSIEHRRDAAVQRSTTVRYDDLNLDELDGVATLYARLERAANRVCGPRLSMQHQPRTWERCHDKALDTAVARVNNQGLTRLHLANSPSSNVDLVAID